MIIGITRAILFCLILFVGSVSSAQGPRLWLLQEPDQVVEYDPATFAQKSSHLVPKDVFKSPQDLQINKSGQMLFLASVVTEADGLTHPSTSRMVWFWDGKMAWPVPRPIAERVTPKGANVLVESAAPRCALSADGGHLFWFDNSAKTLERGDRGIDISTETTFRAWQTDFLAMSPQELTSHAFPACECGTAVCSESCPEGSFWWPDEGVGDFFVMTQWVPGQIGSDYQASWVYRKVNGKWSPSKLSAPVERILDAARDKDVVVLLEAELDGGCCGWINESDDQVLLNQGGKPQVVFDEWQTYQNRNYDISFYASNAKLSPNQRFVAMTIEATHKPGDDIRLADEGKENLAELAQIKKTLPDMPAVKVAETGGDPAKQIATIPHAMFVGWLNDHELLMVENGLLAAYDVQRQTRRTSQIKVKNPWYAQVR